MSAINWTSHPEAMIHLASCAAVKPVIEDHRRIFTLGLDEWRDSEDARYKRLEMIRDEWCANRVGFSWEGPRPGDPSFGTQEWEQMRQDYYVLRADQPSVEEAINAAAEAARATPIAA